MDFGELQRWLESQTELWQQLVSNQTTAEAEDFDWQPLIDACEKLSSQQTHAMQRELAEAMTAQVKSFCAYGVRLIQQLKDPHPTDNLDTLVLDFSHHLQQQALQVLLRQWRLPTTLAQISTAQSPEALSPFGLVEQILSHLSRQANEPRVQALAEELKRFNGLLQRYQQQLERLNYTTSRELLNKLQKTDADINLGALHGLWVECYEEQYQALLLTPGYQQLYGELTNSTLTLNLLGRAFWQEEYRQLGLVPQKDYDDLLHSHHSLRKQLRQSQQVTETLHKRFAALERSVEQIKTPPITPVRKRNL